MASAPPLRVSLVLTVLNESASLPALLDSIAEQTRRPDEIVICDGGSTDDSLSLLRAERRLSLRILEAPGANISRGRNLAIAAAAGDIIACTDAGVRLDRHWLERITESLAADGRPQPPDHGTPAKGEGQTTGDRQPATDDGQPATDGQRPAWAAGFFVADPRPGQPFDAAMSATVLPELRDIDPARFLPSSRSVAYLKSAWQEVGGYPEWLDYCEDLVFDLAMRDRFGPPAFVPEAVAHFRPRTTLRSFFRQYYRYARGDGKANLWLHRHLVRYATYLIAFPALVAGAMALPSPAARAACGALVLLGAAAYLRAPYRRLLRWWQPLSTGGKLRAALAVPFIRLTGDIAKMIGYPVGVAWRCRGCWSGGCRSRQPAVRPAESPPGAARSLEGREGRFGARIPGREWAAAASRCALPHLMGYTSRHGMAYPPISAVGAPVSTRDIYNYVKVSDDLITGGQPTADQLRAAAQEGFTTVINLAAEKDRLAPEDEAELVQSLGMVYHHIPVDWDNPTQADFTAFERVMAQLPPGKTLIHCAANYRVTAFYALYAQKHLGWSEAQADGFRATIWAASAYPVWDQFIARMKRQITP